MNVQWLIGARFLGLLADQMSTYLIPVFIYAATGSVGLSGVAFAVQWLPRVLSLPVLGMLVDRFAIEQQFLLNDLSRAGVLLAVAAFSDPVALMAASAVLTLLNGHAVIATETVIAKHVPADQMSDAQSKVQVAQQLSFTSGPALGAALLAWPGLSGGAVAIAAILMVTAVVTSLVLGPVPRTAPLSSPLRAFADGARAVASRPLVLLMSLTVVLNLVAGLALGALPVIVVGEFAAAPSSVGLVAGAASVTSLLAAVLANRLARRMSIDVTMLGACVVLVVSGPLMGLAPSLVVFAAAYGLWTAGVTVFTIWMRTRRMEYLPADTVGGALGFFVATVLAATPVAGVVLSLLGDALGPQRLLLVMFGVSALLAVPLVVAWLRVRRSRAAVAELVTARTPGGAHGRGAAQSDPP